ncbi:protein ULTRAPETALA 2-like [Carica papaya]|uniref:protein ULTRAPETALA 2-like n=1 Tax=Carica papaya TaxID=3649 RepID=UPI000B8CAE4B|nr:protein ULTRAPETALA 2-like [Carica papaya]
MTVPKKKRSKRKPRASLLPSWAPERVPERVPEHEPERVPEHEPEHLPEHVPERVPVGGNQKMLPEEKLKEIYGYEREEDHIEVLCGCTNSRLGDLSGKLNIYFDGTFLVACECPSCYPEKLTMSPYEFEKHADREGTRNWKSHVWVTINGEKVPLSKSGLLVYYKNASNLNNRSKLVRGKQQFHRDEFITCTLCRKDRRFRVRTAEEYRRFHDALANKKWSCPNWPYEK